MENSLLAEFASPSQIKQLYGISRSQVYRHLRAGDFQAVKSGTRTCIDLATVRAYLRRQRPATFSVPRKAA